MAGKGLASVRQALDRMVAGGAPAALAEYRDCDGTHRLATGVAELGTDRPVDPAGGMVSTAADLNRWSYHTPDATHRLTISMTTALTPRPPTPDLLATVSDAFTAR